MNWRADIPLDGRDPDAILEQILARRLGYVPEWNPSRVSAAAGLARITARYLHVVLQRLNQAPEKNKLAFLDALGLQLVPAQASRVPIVFQLSADAMAGAAPAGSAVAAPPPPEGTTQVVFETERAIGIAAGKIAQVFTLWPGRDEYIDHSGAFEKGTPIRLYDKALRKATPHRLYLAHDTLLALAGNAEVLVDFELTQPSGEHLDILWEYWDGEVWREFLNMNPACTTDKQDKLDSTEGLTKSGRYVLKTDCAESAKTEVDGVEGAWIRGRLTEPLPPDSTKFLPEVDRIRLSSAVNQPLRPRLTASIADPPLRRLVQHPFVASAVLVTEAGVPLAGANLRLTDANDPNLSYPSQPGTADGEYTFAGAAADTDYDLQVIFQGFSASVRVSLPAAEHVLDLLWTMEGLAPDKAYADGTELDVTKPFYPLGQQPTPGTTFYFANEEILSKPGAQFQIYFSKTESSLEQTGFSSGAVLTR